MAATTVKKILLKSSDGEEFEVDQDVALESQTIKGLIEEGSEIDVIPVHGAILSKVIEYCKKHAEHKNRHSSNDTSSVPNDEELQNWDAEFMKVDWDTIYDVTLAAKYLNIKSLLELLCQTLVNMIKGKSPEEIRKTFNIVNDYTPEEEEEFRREHQWIFE